MLQSGKRDAEFYRGLWDSVKEKGSWQGEIWDRRKNGEVYPKWLSITAITDERGVGAVAFGDILLEDLKEYRESNLALVGMKGIFPIWKRDTAELARSFSDSGFKAIVTCIDSQGANGLSGFISGFWRYVCQSSFMKKFQTRFSPQPLRFIPHWDLASWSSLSVSFPWLLLILVKYM
jgi:hypothetical protein